MLLIRFEVYNSIKHALEENLTSGYLRTEVFYNLQKAIEWKIQI